MRAYGVHDSGDNDNDNSISYYADNEVDLIRRKLNCSTKILQTDPLPYTATTMSVAMCRRELQSFRQKPSK
jgi:hypothetical protein